VPAGELIAVLAQLPRLRDLRLKGAPSEAMCDILAHLPELVALDTEYKAMSRAARAEHAARVEYTAHAKYAAPLPRLQRLTVRTSSVDLQGPKELWEWLPQLIPRPSLEAFTLHAFTTQGYMTIPPRFLQRLADVHSDTLRQFCVDQSQLALADIAFIAASFLELGELSCAVTSSSAVRRSASGRRCVITSHLVIDWSRPRERKSASYAQTARVVGSEHWCKPSILAQLARDHVHKKGRGGSDGSRGFVYPPAILGTTTVYCKLCQQVSCWGRPEGYVGWVDAFGRRRRKSTTEVRSGGGRESGVKSGRIGIL
jgi:hypothetical protein